MKMTSDSLVISQRRTPSSNQQDELSTHTLAAVFGPAMNSSPVVHEVTSNSSIGRDDVIERSRVAFGGQSSVDSRLTKTFDRLRMKSQSARGNEALRKPLLQRTPTDSATLIKPRLQRSSTDTTSPLKTESFDFFLPGKKVQFSVDSYGRVNKETFEYQQQRTKKEALECWYTQAEFKGFRQECKREAIAQQKTEFRKHFGAVYDACKKGSFKQVTKERAYISAASCRGLEAVVYSALQADRRNLIITVLKTQHALPDSFSMHKRDETIASASRFLSKQARQLARVLGSGDAAVVVANGRLEASRGKLVPQVYSS